MHPLDRVNHEASHLWLTVCNSRPKSHSGLGGMGPGTGQATQNRGAILIGLHEGQIQNMH